LVKENLLKLNNHNYIFVSTPVASIYNHPTFSSELITQALFWEKLILCDSKNNWHLVKQRDGYEGWIHSFYITDSSIYENNELLQDQNNWYWVKNKFLNLSLEGNPNFLISYGSLIPCFKDKECFFTIFPDSKKVIIDEQSLSRFTDSIKDRNDIICSSKKLIGTPYLWGGKSSFGFDCSGLLQAILNVSNIKDFPRDTSQQILSNMLLEKKGTPNIGDIIFFKMNDKVDHVGLYINNRDFIHSSGSVKINSIDKESEYYSNKLKLNLYGVYDMNTKC